jgi:DNA-binding NarL/FixJ family response regulator
VLKSVADRDLVEACRAVMRERSFIYPDALTALMREYLQRAAPGGRLPDSILSAREAEGSSSSPRAVPRRRSRTCS